MAHLIHELITETARERPEHTALGHKERRLSYRQLSERLARTAQGYHRLGLARGERVAVYLAKQPETVEALFAASAADAAFVPINPLLKPEQVAYMLRDCQARVLVTSAARARELASALGDCPSLRALVLVDGTTAGEPETSAEITTVSLDALHEHRAEPLALKGIDADLAAILYTSGSTGKPKGVMLSHRNLLAGARSVAQYLGNHERDRLLAALPLSFDYGLSQVTTAFSVGAGVFLIDYLLPNDVVQAVARFGITGLAAVPPMWNQLAQCRWPEEARHSLRYFTNSGGALSQPTLATLRELFPQAEPYLMYGLTEAFRSTYLPPSQIDERPQSIGRAIPNAEVLVLHEDGSRCAPGEPGELVHRGTLVAMGYWQDSTRTRERFKPLPGGEGDTGRAEIAVWSGDRVYFDEAGYLYFLGRRDEMIKTSGYRVSPNEIEEVVDAADWVAESAALGVPHPQLGQAIVVLAVAHDGHEADTEALLHHCRAHLANFMVPKHIELRSHLPRNPNGKLDRSALQNELNDWFEDA